IETAPGRGRAPRRALAILGGLAIVAGAAAAFLSLRGDHAPEPPPAAAPVAEPRTPMPEPQDPVREPQPAKPEARSPIFDRQRPVPETRSPKPDYTTFRRALTESEFMHEYDRTRPTDIQQYDGARLRVDLASFRLFVELDTPHRTHPGPIYQWTGRGEILLPACDVLETPLLCDVVGGRVHEVPADALLQKDDALAVDKAAITPLARAQARVQVTIDVGFLHMLFVLIDADDGLPPILAGFGYSGQRLPVRPKG
ncbi:MAG TPA: hypothetical protein PKL84_04005, partial [Candidatus Hydrogenedentes bacterium]|nr:hypothetical protein [Candidatus Hydrogenedentota bacterium]